MFKNILARLLLCFVIFDPVIATFTCLYYQKTVAKKEVDRRIVTGIDREDLVLLKFLKEDVKTKLRWENSKEFEYNREMYDVVETMSLDDAVYFWCLLDHKETNLNRQLEELSAQAFGKDRKIRGNNEPLISFSRSLYIPDSFDWDGSASELPCKQCFLFFDFYSSISVQPPTPPPQAG